MICCGFRLFLAMLLPSLLSVVAYSQVFVPPPTVATGVQPFGSFDGGPDVINLGDLNVHWSFPVVHKAGRGMDFNYSLTYDSGEVSPDEAWGRLPVGNESWSEVASSPKHAGWYSVGPGGTQGVLYHSEISLLFTQTALCSNGVGLTDYNYIYVDGLGNSHMFGSGVYTQDCPNSTEFGFPATATDGSGITLLCNSCGVGSNAGFAILLPSGQTIIVPPSNPNDSSVGVCTPTATQSIIEDTNGNMLWWNNASIFDGASIGADNCYIDVNAKTGLPAYYDTLGSQVMITTAEGYYDTSSNPSSQYPVGTPDGLQDGTGTFQDANITMTFPGLGTSYTITNSSFDAASLFGCPNVGDYDVGQNLVTKLQRQDGSFYKFSYQPTQAGGSTVTGMLSYVGLPQGGSISYTYGSTNCMDLSPMSLIRKVDDGNGHVSQWTYQRSYLPTTSQWQTIVTDPSGNQTVHLFVTGITGAIPAFTVGDRYIDAESMGTINFYEVSKTVYSGPVSSGIVMQVTNTCYNTNPTGAYVTNCITALPFTYPIVSVQTAITPDGGALTGATVQLFNAIGLPVESDVYDYGNTNGQAGALLSRTTTAYAALGNILNKPAAVIQHDGNGNILSSTSYTYDEGDVITTSGTPGHANIYQAGINNWVNIANRGNLTTIKHWGGTTPLTSSFTYYDTGLVAIATDSNGAVTSYNYSQCGNSFLSGKIQTVQPSGAILSTSELWNCDGAVPVSMTDVNGNVSTMSYVDPFWRPTSEVDAIGDTTAVTYPNISSNTGSVSKTYVGGIPASNLLTTYDGLGRAILTQVQQGPGSSGYTSSAQLYDPFGHVTWSSIPYSASVGSYITSGPGTNAIYDALGRPQSISDAGGGTLSYTYKQNDTMITQGPAAPGESVKSRQLEYNAAGQLTSVCEITSGTASGPCGQNANAIGYLTKYNYFGSLLAGVSQNVQAGPSATQSRSISYDSLGRKIAETIPETGTSKFYYDFTRQCGSSIGDMVESIDNAGNITCMGYDSLHRLTSSQVVSGPYAAVTPQTTYVYDVASLNGTPMQNALGSLAAVHTSLCPASGCIATDVYQNSYFETSGGQKTGRVISQMWESTPHSNGYVLTQSIANANGTPVALSASLNGAPVGFPTMTYGLDTWGRPATATDTTSNTSLLSSTSYDPVTGAVTGLTYGNGDTDGFGFDPNTGRPTSFAYSIGGPNSFAISGALTWNPNGSLQTFLMNDMNDPTKNQNCQYQMDDINRLASVNCAGSWAQSFNYDPFGNISKSGPANAGPGQMTQSYMAGYGSINNQVMSGANAAYDWNGNQTLAEMNSITWNAAAQPVSVNGVGAVYDGLGRVVETDSSNIPAGTDSPSSGSITIAGSEQMIAASLSAGASAVVTFTGVDQSMPINLDTTEPDGCVPVITTTAQYATCYDTGGGYLVILTYDASTGGFLSQSLYSFNYSAGDTAATISDRLAATINADPAARFIASAVPGAPANQGMINVQLASASSTAVVYNVLAGVGCGDDFPSCSFSIDVPAQMTASQTSCKIPAVYDSGTVTATINNGPVASYPWTSSDNAVSIARGLSAAINLVYGSGGLNLVNASAPAGSTVVQLTSIGNGPATNYPVATSVSFNSTDFQSSSFTTTAAGMAGGLYSGAGTTAGSTQYVYSPSGAKIAILQGGQLVKGTVPLPGGGTAIYNGVGLSYLRHKDWLGSSRLATRWDHSVYSKEAYAPFGETENNMEVGAMPDRSFTGQDQDTTTGVYDYLFRRYDPVAGRWMSPDPAGWSVVDLTNPQSFNRFAYGANGPLDGTDPLGLVYLICGEGVDSRDGLTPVGLPPASAGCTYVSNQDYENAANDPATRQQGTPVPAFGTSGYIYNNQITYYSDDGQGATQNTPTAPNTPIAPSNFVRMPLPGNHLNCTTSTGVSFPAPPGFSVSNIAANGAANGLAGAGAAVGQGGYYDFQRFQVGSVTQFFSGYTPVANVAVGAYVEGTGAPQWMASLISNTYAFFKSSNGATAQQAQFRNLGFSLAAGKASYSCQPSIP